MRSGQLTVRVSGVVVSTLALALFLSRTPAGAQTAEQYRQRAKELSSARSWDDAIANYHKALELEPNDAMTHYNLALALKYKGDMPQAADEFEAALRLKPKWADAHYGLGATSYDRHDLPAAQRELRAAVELDPQNVPAHRLLARIYSQQNDPLSAARELVVALQIKKTPDLHFELAMVEGQRGNLDAAAAEFRQALRHGRHAQRALGRGARPVHLWCLQR